MVVWELCADSWFGWKMQQSEILALAGLRIDGRRFNELRKIKYKIAVSQQQSAANGSTYLEQGLNKVLVEVYGPKEMKNKGNEISMIEKVNLKMEKRNLFTLRLFRVSSSVPSVMHRSLVWTGKQKDR
jgi:hypothetical protein